MSVPAITPATASSAVKGGAIRTSRPGTRPTLATSAFASGTSSPRVPCIFQLPASIGVRLMLDSNLLGTAPLAEALADQQGHVAHPVREAPLVVVPGQHLQERLVDHAGERAVEDGGVRRAVEVRRDQRLVAVVEDALQRARGGNLDGGGHRLLPCP